MQSGSHTLLLSKGVLSSKSYKGSKKISSLRQNLKKNNIELFLQRVKFLKTHLPPAVTEQVLIMLVTRQADILTVQVRAYFNLR